MSDVYELYRRGTALLEARDYHAATVALSRARDLDPEPDLDPRGAGPRLLPRRASTRRRAAEFEAVVQRAPTNDYALFCLGRSLQQLGRHAEARRPLALAACLRPTGGTTACTATEPAPRREPAANLRLTPQPAGGPCAALCRRRLRRQARFSRGSTARRRAPANEPGVPR